jgi:hypothetical protein
MYVTVTNTAPDFNTVFIPPTNVKIPILGTGSFPIPSGFKDAEGGTFYIYTVDSPPAGYTALTATWDSTNSLINLKSTTFTDLGYTGTPLYGQITHTVLVRVYD